MGIGPGTCSFCLSMVESSNHILITCPSVIVIWGEILNWLGKSVLYSSCAKDHFLEFCEVGTKCNQKEGLGLVWQSTI